MYHTNINLPVKFIPYDYGDTEETLRFKKNHIDFSKINTEFFDWLSDNNLSCCPKLSRYFCSRPNQRYAIHADSKNSLTLNTKLNIIIDSVGTIMKWYEVRKPFDRLPDSFFFTGAIRNYQEHQVNEIFSVACDTPCLIDGAQIHTLINGNNNNMTRKCYSFTLKDTHTNQYVSYDEAKARLTFT